MSKPMNQLQWIAIAVSVALHLAVLVFVLFGHVVEPPQEPAVNSVKVRMVMLPAPVPPKLVEQPKAKPVVKKQVKPKKKIKPVVQETKFAKKRVEEKPKPKPEPLPEPEIEPLPEIAVVEETVEVEPLPEVIEPQPTVAQAEAAVEAEVSETEVSQSPAPAAAEKPFNVDQYQPVSKKAPKYPRSALNKNIEGICTIQYTVNEQGKVEAPEALSDCHPYFINASLRAAKTFQYTPRMVNGQAVKVPNVKNAFHFKIE